MGLFRWETNALWVVVCVNKEDGYVFSLHIYVMLIVVFVPPRQKMISPSALSVTILPKLLSI